MRIERLLAQQTTLQTNHSRVVTFSVRALVSLMLLAVQGVNIIIIISLTHCNPLALLTKLL